MPTISGRYAVKTKTSTGSSQAEVERLLRKYQADQFFSGWSDNTAVVGFRLRGRVYRIRVPLPDPDDDELFRWTQGSNRYGTFRRQRSQQARDNLYEQAVRTRWRAMLLIVKAKLEAVDLGVMSFEEAFISDTLLPNEQTLGEWAEDQVTEAYAHGTMPERLPGFPSQPALPKGC